MKAHPALFDGEGSQKIHKTHSERSTIIPVYNSYNTIQLSFIPRPVYRYPVLESATRESLLFQQSTFMPQHSVDVVSYFHSVRGSAALLHAHPKNLHAQAEPWCSAQPGTQCTTLLRRMKAGWALWQSIEPYSRIMSGAGFEPGSVQFRHR